MLSPYVDGLSEDPNVIVIFALFTVKVCALLTPPPGVGLNTVICAVVVGAVISLAGIVAVSCVELAKTVVRSDPLRRTTDAETKFVPLTVIVNCASPTVLELGDMPVVVGTGLRTCMTGDNPMLVSVPPASKRDCVVNV